MTDLANTWTKNGTKVPFSLAEVMKFHRFGPVRPEEARSYFKAAKRNMEETKAAEADVVKALKKHGIIGEDETVHDVEIGVESDERVLVLILKTRVSSYPPTLLKCS